MRHCQQIYLSSLLRPPGAFCSHPTPSQTPHSVKKKIRLQSTADSSNFRLPCTPHDPFSWSNMPSKGTSRPYAWNVSTTRHRLDERGPDLPKLGYFDENAATDRAPAAGAWPRFLGPFGHRTDFSRWRANRSGKNYIYNPFSPTQHPLPVSNAVRPSASTSTSNPDASYRTSPKLGTGGCLVSVASPKRLAKELSTPTWIHATNAQAVPHIIARLLTDAVSWSQYHGQESDD